MSKLTMIARLALWAGLVLAIIAWRSERSARQLCERDRALHVTEMASRLAASDSALASERKLHQLKVDSYRSAIHAFSCNEDFVQQEALRIYVLKLDSLSHE